MRAELFRRLSRALDEERLVAVATVVAGPAGEAGRQMLLAPGEKRWGSLGSAEIDQAAAEASASFFARFASGRLDLASAGLPAPAAERIEVFLEVHPPRPQLIVIGAVHTAIPLVSFANALGFRTVVVDPRGAFATRERFAHADELLRDWPQEALAGLTINEATFAAVLSHDLKLDLPALEVLLASPARYIGALGSKKTHAKRRAALLERGITDAELGRIHAPIGLDLGGRRPEEIAVAIIAEIVAVHHGRRAGV